MPSLVGSEMCIRGKNQAVQANTRCLGLSVSVELIDYRKISGTFDRVVSVDMFEHVGPRNYRVFF